MHSAIPVSFDETSSIDEISSINEISSFDEISAINETSSYDEISSCNEMSSYDEISYIDEIQELKAQLATKTDQHDKLATQNKNLQDALTVANLEKSSLYLANKKLQKDYEALGDKSTEKDSRVYLFACMVLTMMSNGKKFNLGTSLESFLSAYVPASIHTKEQEIVFNDLDDPIVRAFMKLSPVRNPFSGETESAFVSRVKGLFNDGFYEVEKMCRKKHSIILGDFVADFSSHSGLSNSITLSFSDFKDVIITKASRQVVPKIEQIDLDGLSEN